MSQMSRKQQFIALFDKKSSDKYTILSQVAHDKLVNETVVAKQLDTKKDPKQRRRTKRYDVIQDNGRDRLNTRG